MEKQRKKHNTKKVAIPLDLPEKEKIEFGLKQWGHRAYTDALSKGVAVSVLRGNRVYQIQDGNAEVIETIPQTKYKISQRTFKLKK